MKYVLGLKPRFTSPALIRGGIVHDAHEAYYDAGWDVEAGIECIERSFDERLDEFEEAQKMPEIKADSIAMFRAWDAKFRGDQKVEKLVEYEKQRTFKIGPNNDFDFTVRMDRVFRSPERRMMLIRDTKTTSYSVPKAFQSADAEDQMTAYLWAANRIWPDERSIVVEVDVLYKRASVVKAERCGPIYRTPYDLARFELELYGIIAEISQKYAALESLPHQLLFPRNGLTCSIFSCEYAPICRLRLEHGAKPPLGFVNDPWVEENKLLTKAQESFNIELIAKGVKK